MTGGAVSMEMVNGIVDMVNGKWGSGFRKVVKGYFHNKRETRKYEKLLEGSETGSMSIQLSGSLFYLMYYPMWQLL